MKEHGTVLIYYARFDTPLPAARFALLLERLPVAMQQKVTAFSRWEDAHASLSGKLLLQRACLDLGLSGDLCEVRYSAFGRPYLENGPDFNISHSGNVVVCAVSTAGRTGIDIELNIPVNLEDFRDHFAEEEWQHILAAPDPLPVFYKYWTIKEAVLKAQGSGFQASLAALHVTDPASIFYAGRQWHIKAITGFGNYTCHAASQEGRQRYELRETALMNWM
jgi:4'-phosphopantetheinyl transferase